MSRLVCFVCFLTALTAFAQTSPTATQKDSEKLPTLVTRTPSGDKQKAGVEKPKADKAKPKADLSKEAFVIEEITTLASFEADGTGSRETTTRVRIQSDAGVQAFGLLTFGYQKAFEELDIHYVRVRKPDARVIETSMDNVQDLDSEITRAAPFYSDLREKHVAVRGLGIGDTLEWQIAQREVKALAPGHFWLNYEFTTRAIILNEHFQLSVPRELALKVRSPDFKFEVREQSGRRIYEWKHSQLERKEDPKEKFRSPFRLPEPDVLISTFGSWDEIGRWYDSLQKERVKPSPEVQAKALELTKNAKTDEEKIRALYDYVATQFRYIGVAFGIGRYQPHAADDVLGNSYGDCKDKHTLLASLLQAVGIEAWPALINSSHVLDADAPSPAQFDHVITVVPRSKDKKELLWLDTTAEVAPFGQLVTSLRDKQALVIPPNTPASLVRTPVEPAFVDSEQFRITGTLSESGELHADVEQQMRGDSEILVRSAFRQVPQPRWTELVQNLSYARGYGGTVSEVSTSAPEKTSEPFRFSYKYDRKDYSDWSNKRITPPLPPIGLLTLDEEHEKSGQPVLLNAPAELNYTSEIRLPASYTPEIPQGIDLKTDFAEYHSKYSLAGDVLRAERRLTIKKGEVPSTAYSQYKEFRRKVSDDATSWITFSEKEGETGKKPGVASSNGNTPASKPTWPAMPDSEAGRLYSKGLERFQIRDFRGALEKFEEAAKLDPKLPGIWSEIGKMHLALNEVDKGLEEMQRQVKETPEVPGGYKMLAFALISMHREADAIRVARELVKLSPNDSDGQSYLGYCLVALKQYKEAIDTLEQAVKLNNSDHSVYFQLGNAYLGVGDGDKAYEAYAKAVDLDLTYSAIRNDAAYSLTEKNVHLKEATLWAKEAVTDKEDQTRNIDLDHLEMKDVWLMNQLSAYWDTLGWAYFQAGDYAGAERYLLASWWLRQDTVVGDHVGQVYEKMHNPRKAARFYSLANAAPDAGGKASVREHLAHLSPAVVDKTDYAAALGAMRTFHLPRITADRATAEFFILFTNNGEERIPAMERTADNKAPEGKADNTTSHFVEGSASSDGGESHIKASVEQVKFITGSEELRKAEDVLRKIDFGVPFPDNSLTKIVRRGILACEPHSGCDFVLMTAESVRSVN